MKLYKLSLHVELTAMGELPDTPEPGNAAKHPMLQDPLDRQSELMDRAEQMLGRLPTALRPAEPEQSACLHENYELPVSGFFEVLEILCRFHTLAGKLGLPLSQPTRE